MEGESVIDDFVNSRDILQINREFLKEIKEYKSEANISYLEMGMLTGIPQKRLQYLLDEAEKPELYKEEVDILRHLFGIGEERVYGLPRFSVTDRHTVNKEIELMKQRGNPLAQAWKDVTDNDYKRIVLYMIALRECSKLHKSIIQ